MVLHLYHVSWFGFRVALTQQDMLRVGETALRVKALSVLPSPRTYMATYKLSVVPVSGNLTPFSVFHRYQAHMWCTDIAAGKTHTHTEFNRNR